MALFAARLTPGLVSIALVRPRTAVIAHTSGEQFSRGRHHRQQRANNDAADAQTDDSFRSHRLTSFSEERD